jgi:hypothetical protein
VSPAKCGDRFRGLQQCQGFADAWLESRRVLQMQQEHDCFCPQDVRQGTGFSKLCHVTNVTGRHDRHKWNVVSISKMIRIWNIGEEATQKARFPAYVQASLWPS